jgi:hypothetical protein
MPEQMFRMALPPRIQGAIDFMGAGRWRLWLHTPDYIHGTYLDMYSDGKITRVTVREDEGDEVVTLKGAE